MRILQFFKKCILLVGLSVRESTLFFMYLRHVEYNGLFTAEKLTPVLLTVSMATCTKNASNS